MSDSEHQPPTTDEAWAAPARALEQRLRARIERTPVEPPLAISLSTPRVEPFTLEIREVVTEIATVDPDPAHMSRLKVTKEPRAVERPAAIWDHLQRITPQYFLRNTARLERHADLKWLAFESKTVRPTSTVARDLADAHRCHFDRALLPAPTVGDHLREHLADRRALMVESRWHEQFGRPDPLESPKVERP